METFYIILAIYSFIGIAIAMLLYLEKEKITTAVGIGILWLPYCLYQIHEEMKHD